MVNSTIHQVQRTEMGETFVKVRNFDKGNDVLKQGDN